MSFDSMGTNSNEGPEIPVLTDRIEEIDMPDLLRETDDRRIRIEAALNLAQVTELMAKNTAENKSV